MDMNNKGVFNGNIPLLVIFHYIIDADLATTDVRRMPGVWDS